MNRRAFCLSPLALLIPADRYADWVPSPVPSVRVVATAPAGYTFYYAISTGRDAWMFLKNDRETVAINLKKGAA